MGEGNLWHKFTNYEHSVRVPLLVKVPWMTGLAGTIISAPVELIDIYPTAAALTKSGALDGLDGVDFSPVLLNSIRGRSIRPIRPPGASDGSIGPVEPGGGGERVKLMIFAFKTRNCV